MTLKIKALLALLATPLLVVLSNAVTVYLNNISDLDYQLSLLLPYLMVSLAILLIGLLLLAMSRFSGFHYLLWAYLLAGPLYLLYNLLRRFELLALEEKSGFGVFFLMCIAVSVFLAQRHDWRKILTPLAFGSALLLGLDLARLAVPHLGHNIFAGEAKKITDLRSSQSERPNIYHILLDEFQSDHFARQLNGSVEQSLQGFTFYQSASANYDMTAWAVPSAILGELYRFDESPDAYKQRAFNSPDSAHFHIKDAGYVSLAVSRRLFPVGFNHMDLTLPHSLLIETDGLEHSGTFNTLWFYSTVPKFAAESLAFRNILIDKNSLANIKSRTFLADASSIESYLGFKSFLDKEHLLPERGRYTFLHLLIPHGPFTYNADCERRSAATTDSQVKCAVNMLEEFVNKLKALDRFNDSLILVHGDHGSRWTYDNPDGGSNDGEMTRGKRRSHKTLLLVKPPGNEQPFRTSSQPVEILDVSGLLKSFVASKQPAEFASQDYFSKRVEGRTERHFYRVKGERGMDHHIVKYGLSKSLGNVDIPLDLIKQERDQLDIPVFPVNQEFEAELGFLSSGASLRDDMDGVSGQYVVGGTKMYAFELDHPSEVSLRARVISPNSNSDSSLLRYNNEHLRLWSMGISKEWRWTTSKTNVTLPAGKHRFSIEYREPVYLDMLKINARAIGKAAD